MLLSLLWFLLKFIAFNLKKKSNFQHFFRTKIYHGFDFEGSVRSLFLQLQRNKHIAFIFFMFVVKNIYKCNTLDTIVHCLWDLICIYNIECRISYDRLKEVHSWNCYIKGSYLDLQKSLINNFVSQSTNKIALSRETLKYGLS